MQLLVVLVRGHLNFPLGLLITIRRLGSILSLVTGLCLVRRLGLKSTLHLRTNPSRNSSLGLKTRLSLSGSHYLSARLSRPGKMSLNRWRSHSLSGSLPWLNLRWARLPRRPSLLGTRFSLYCQGFSLRNRGLGRLDDWLTLLNVRLTSLSRWLDSLSSGLTLLRGRMTTLPRGIPLVDSSLTLLDVRLSRLS